MDATVLGDCSAADEVGRVDDFESAEESEKTLSSVNGVCCRFCALFARLSPSDPSIVTGCTVLSFPLCPSAIPNPSLLRVVHSFSLASGDPPSEPTGGSPSDRS